MSTSPFPDELETVESRCDYCDFEGIQIASMNMHDRGETRWFKCSNCDTQWKQ